MARKLVYKVKIDEIEPMDADNLEAARVMGWRIVVQKGQFKAGDVALYFEIDSALNPHDDRFVFLKERCYKKFSLHGKLFDECLRIRTIKLRGVLSQGLLMPCEEFCEVRNKKLEEDCGDVLMVRHYDEVAEKAAYEAQSLRPANQKGNFPWFVPKTDEERIQNISDRDLEALKDIEFEVTEKMDGTSCTVFYAASHREEDPFGVCSRNFELKDDVPPADGSDFTRSTYWEMVHKLDLDRKLKDYCEEHGVSYAIQGEITGPGIQNNRDAQDTKMFHVFRIWDIGEQCWLTWADRYEVCKSLGIDHVPILGFMKPESFSSESGDPSKYNGEPFNAQVVRDNILQYAEGKTQRGNEREGIVFKSESGIHSFKAVSNKYLLGLK